MSDTQPPRAEATGLRVALAASLLMLVLLGLGLMNVVPRRPHGSHSMTTDTADSLTTGALPNGPDELVAEDADSEDLDSQPSPQTAEAETSDSAASNPESSGSDPETPGPRVSINKPPKKEPAAIPPGPWSSAFEVAGEPPEFSDICFTDFDTDKSLPISETLKAWFSAVPGERLSISDVHSSPGQTGRFSGLMRLRMPMRENVGLRLSMTNLAPLKIHLFHGTTGTTLAYYERERHRWVAYETTRQAGKSRPETYIAAAADEARTRRTRLRDGGTLQLICRAGEVVLSHGDVILLRAPLDEIPDEVYFEGEATFYGIAAFRSEFPTDQSETPPVVFETDQPAELSWQKQLGEGGKLELRPDGMVELVATDSKQVGWVTTPLRFSGICEVLCQLDEVTAGTGIYLGPGAEKPILALRFVKDTRSGKLTCSLQDSEIAEHSFEPTDHHFAPRVGAKPWVRLLFACGAIHWWFSNDGVHWANGDKHYRDSSESATCLGMTHLSGLKDARIRLRSIQIRSLAEFNSLVDPELVKRATPWSRAANAAVWLVKTTETQPPDVDAELWRRASAVRTLANGCPKNLGTALIDLLLDDAARRELAPDRQLALLDEAALMLTVRDDHAQREALMVRYHELAMEAFRREGKRPYSWIRPHLMGVPLASHDEVTIVKEETIRAEVIQLSHQRRWADLLKLCRQLRFFRQTNVAPLVDWAEATALRNLPHGAGGERIVGRKDAWSPVWIEEVSKPTYNLLAEVQAMRESEAWADIARVISTLRPDDLSGLAPDLNDPGHYWSLPTAITDVVAQSPQLADVLAQQYGDIARLRVQRAIQYADVETLRLATVQFSGTDAAATAHRWLGDRALTGGWFSTALRHYQMGQTGNPVLDRDLVARQRLAAAMQGQRIEGELPAEVVFGEFRLSGDEFEQLLDEMLARQPDVLQPHEQSQATKVPEPTGYRVQRRGRMNGPLGKDPSSQVSAQVLRFQVDWVGKQLAHHTTSDTLYLTNRFFVAAHSLSDGARRWQAVPSGMNLMRSQDWGLMAMQPLLTRERIFARLMYEPGPKLVCLNRSDGQIRWTAETPQNESIASDPHWVQGQLVAFTVKRQEQGTNVLRLTLFDAETGQVQASHDLTRIHDVWWRMRCCEAVVVDDVLIVVMGGLVLSCDLDGHVRWLRQQTALPSDEAPGWAEQSFQPPLVDRNRILVAQPGVRAVECFESETGRLVWTRVMPDIERMIGRAGTRLIVHNGGRLTALDLASGERIWEHETLGIFLGAACDAQRILVLQPASSRRLTRKEGCHLVWLETDNGDAIGTTALPEINHTTPRIGPLIFGKDRIWTFFGQGNHDANPELIELIPEGEADPAWEPTQQPSVWTKQVPLDLLKIMSQRFPDWEVLSGRGPKTGLINAERHGKKDVLVTEVHSGVSTVFSRAVAIPSSGQPRLRLTVGHSGIRDWSLEVRLNGEVLQHQDFSGRSQNQPWTTIEVDLSPAAGKRGQLQIEAADRGGDQAVQVYWGDIEIVF